MDHDDSERVSATEVVRGLTVGSGLPQSWTPVAAIVLVKCLDEDGEATWAFRTSDGLNDEELLGALTVRLELQKKYLLGLFGEE
jgi:hypothetical protein